MPLLVWVEERFFLWSFCSAGAPESSIEEKSKRPIHTVELREIYIQAPKEGNLRPKYGGASQNAPLCMVVHAGTNGKTPNLES